jgi:hypothetical protein
VGSLSARVAVIEQQNQAILHDPLRAARQKECEVLLADLHPDVLKFLKWVLIRGEGSEGFWYGCKDLPSETVKARSASPHGVLWC